MIVDGLTEIVTQFFEFRILYCCANNAVVISVYIMIRLINTTFVKIVNLSKQQAKLDGLTPLKTKID